MSIKFMKLKKDDTHFGYKEGDIFVIESNYGWDPDKVICIGKIDVKNNHSFYKYQLQKISKEELIEARPISEKKDEV